MELKDRILDYLADGLKASQVATIVGCSAGYISQLCSQEDFKARLEEAIKNNTKPVDDTLTTRYQGLESDLIDAVRQAIPAADMGALTRAMQVVSDVQEKRFRRHNPIQQPAQTNVTVVQLALPAYAVPQAPVVELNSQSEIVSINNQILAPLPAVGVRKLFAGIKEQREKGNNNDRLPNPGT